MRCAVEEAKEIDKHKSDTANHAADIEIYRKLRAQWTEDGWIFDSQSRKFTKKVDGQVKERELPVRYKKP